MKTAIVSIVAAATASACCIGPVALVLLGAGTFGASLALLEPYRPIFIAVTMALLGFGFYAAYRPERSCDLCSPSTRRRTRFVVWLSAVVAVVLVAFPYYVGFLF